MQAMSRWSMDVRQTVFDPDLDLVSLANSLSQADFWPIAHLLGCRVKRCLVKPALKAAAVSVDPF